MCNRLINLVTLYVESICTARHISSGSLGNVLLHTLQTPLNLLRNGSFCDSGKSYIDQTVFDATNFSQQWRRYYQSLWPMYDLVGTGTNLLMVFDSFLLHLFPIQLYTYRCKASMICFPSYQQTYHNAGCLVVPKETINRYLHCPTCAPAKRPVMTWWSVC